MTTTSPLTSRQPNPPIVLLVESDADTRDLYHTALEFDGCWVIDALTANDALVAASDVQPDVIVTEIGLPGGGDGLTLVHQLKSNPKTAAIPVVAVTGRDPRRLGPSGHLFTSVLLKPILTDDLSHSVQDTLRNSATLRQRSHDARERVQELITASDEILARSHKVFASRASVTLVRECPTCQQALAWADRRKMFGVTFDYYRPCANGCGLFCFNHSDRALVRLTE